MAEQIGQEKNAVSNKFSQHFELFKFLDVELNLNARVCNHSLVMNYEMFAD